MQVSREGNARWKDWVNSHDRTTLEFCITLMESSKIFYHFPKRSAFPKVLIFGTSSAELGHESNRMKMCVCLWSVKRCFDSVSGTYNDNQ